MARGRRSCVKCRARPGSGEPRLCEDCWAALDCAIDLDETLDRELWWREQGRLLRLGNGMLVLTSGRPGVQLRISKSGLGDDWSEPVDVLPPTSDKLDVDSCGYTGLVALDRDTFLMVYSWFQKPDAGGRPRKAVLSRRIRLTSPIPAPQSR